MLPVCDKLVPDRIRLVVSWSLSLAIAGVLLWILVPVSDPGTKLINFDIVDGYAKIEMEITNKNKFRGFDYISGGWVELFYVSDSTSDELSWDYTPVEYQDFKKPLLWNFSISTGGTDADQLQTDNGRIYVSLFLKYYCKIFLWKTKTTYYQWLDFDAYFDDKFNFKGKSPACFQRIQNFTLAIST